MSGYGEAKRRRVSTSRGRSAGRDEKRHKSKKDKKEKKHRDGERDDRSRRKRSRSRRDRGDSENEEPPALEKAPETGSEAVLGRKDSISALSAKKEDKKGAWKQEMKKEEAVEVDGEEDGEQPDGIVEEENEEDVDKRLAESRLRREALIAKWVNKGEGPNGQGSLETPDTPMEAGISDDEEDVSEDKPPEAVEELDEESKQLKKDLQRFILQHKAEEGDSMFDETADEDAIRKASTTTAAAISQTGASADDWDDSEGYYKAKIGEVMLGRYLVTEDICGKGVFSNVCKAKDKADDSAVAIKVMRCNDMMKKAAEKEIEILERLNKADKQNKRHVIRLLRHFMYRGHLCLVFECMWDNLRVALKKYTKDKGMSLQAVRAYTRQLLVALRHLHKCQIIHADIKPDNILISAGHNVVKICDLGSAMELTEVEPTPYLVSRFYRAPEICLAAKYSFPLDVFAIGATFFELFTGKILFPGKSNNDMMRLFMEVKGKIPNKLIKSGTETVWKQHFDANMDFKYVDSNKATRKKIVRTITDLSAKKSIMDMVLARVGSEKQKSSETEDQLYVKKSKQFADLVDKMITMDPERRITANDALELPFVAEGGLSSKPAGGAAAKTGEANKAAAKK
mmetsp:Transcript_101304/g.180035  ORF Transcript_101304/g.180035 Transcript_101304/m.180035 type:complete len:626 (+) Transcript_101304:95-1972(+)|eukprot:CAMPEP_0197650128 /NCGR_PEP_ID=MMETSP1338-20131121/30757_1 /TAXON_ID=43686 ORGANISM="Pelagodinium beii, Strain RCC1491" /NCGR_SAMPLE_ID=MMETSP1338 /ASSEMBLY_ACC=CAM_ASM_000754 /LENGTH=625 /DNA_ID=CAMNT_0043224479 /DNA_START=94 /DNA_END=1971 /DNA_ORIENTATION=+